MKVIINSWFRTTHLLVKKTTMLVRENYEMYVNELIRLYREGICMKMSCTEKLNLL